MALQFTRRKAQVAQRDAVNASLASQLQAFGDARLSGMVHVLDRVSGQEALVYLHEGGLYSISLGGYAIPVAARLVSAGVLGPDRLRAIDDVDPDRSTAGPRSVNEGWMEAEALGAMHQEFLLASLGSILSLDRVKVRAKQGEETSFACCVPVAIRPALDAVQMRSERMGADAAALAEALGAGPEAAMRMPDAILDRTSQSMPTSARLPEFTAFGAQCNGTQSLDAAALAAGFTRAEAMHVARILASGGVLTLAGWLTPDPAAPLQVPEQFPSHAAFMPATRPQVDESTAPVASPSGHAGMAGEADAELAALRAELAVAEQRVWDLREKLAQAERRSG